ncbi:Uncharacterised protein [Pseudomonas fragi]|uniref:Uncharacterized protein n=1 Tax=Pseudomonas fragi TaxID=296 RepID=A0A449IS70_PSEFR|nr:Uncharacterised protein [Pseudomonas fragi]
MGNLFVSVNNKNTIFNNLFATTRIGTYFALLKFK